jgi:hypothetical protein
MRAKITELETNQNTNINSIERAYDQSATEQASKLYEADVAAAAKAQAARISAENARLRNYQSNLEKLEKYMLDGDLSVEQKEKLLSSQDLDPTDFEYLANLGGIDLIDFNQYVIPTTKTVGDYLQIPQKSGNTPWKYY